MEYIIFGIIGALSIVLLILFFTGKGPFNQKSGPSFYELAEEDPDVIYSKEEVKVSDDCLHFEDKIGLGKSGIFDGGGMFEHSYRDWESGYNIEFRNKYGTIVDFEQISWTRSPKTGRGAVVIRKNIISYKLDKEIDSGILIRCRNIVPVENFYPNIQAEEIATDNVVFNELYQVYSVNGKVRNGVSDDNDIFYILTPQVMEKMISLNKIFGRSATFIFMKNRMFVTIVDQRLLRIEKLTVPETLKRLKCISALCELGRSIEQEDADYIKSLINK